MKRMTNRRSIRLKNYDYGQAGSYFLTVCTRHRKHIFGEIRRGVMGLNELGCIAYEEWLNTPTIRPNISLGAFVIMPNHMHGIVHIDYASNIPNNAAQVGEFKAPSRNIGAIVRGYKGAVTKRIRLLLEDTSSIEGALGTIDCSQSIWHRNYYEHIIRDNRAYQNIANYIWNNPAKWSQDRFCGK